MAVNAWRLLPRTTRSLAERECLNPVRVGAAVLPQRSPCTLLVVITSVACLLLSSCEWTQYRFGPAHTGHNPAESAITAGNVSQLQAAWAGPQLGIPFDALVVGDSILVGYWDDIRPAALSALDPHHGSVRWSIIFPSNVGTTTPSYGGGRLYVPTRVVGSLDNATLKAYRASDGGLLWSSPSGFPNSAPTVVGDIVYQSFVSLGPASGWEAHDAATGNVLFRARASGFGYPTVAVA
ncbi:MAG: hypothetical protein E6G06_19980, partial [Actinobacteria bacterium]